ncbi:MAG: hypothetical protein QG594_1196 [Bacteroidota bacterium]|nr:hypothetical protein [Bacteroidota bacterium]
MEKNLTRICFFIFFIIIFYIIIKGAKIRNNIEKYKSFSIAKIYGFNTVKGRNCYRYYYFYEQRKYENYSVEGIGEEEESINKFYVLKLSSKEPEFSILDLNQEVTDTVVILRAGFSKEDL